MTLKKEDQIAFNNLREQNLEDLIDMGVTMYERGESPDAIVSKLADDIAEILATFLERGTFESYDGFRWYEIGFTNVANRVYELVLDELNIPYKSKSIKMSRIDFDEQVRKFESEILAILKKKHGWSYETDSKEGTLTLTVNRPRVSVLLGVSPEKLTPKFFRRELDKNQIEGEYFVYDNETVEFGDNFVMTYRLEPPEMSKYMDATTKALSVGATMTRDELEKRGIWISDDSRTIDDFMSYSGIYAYYPCSPISKSDLNKIVSAGIDDKPHTFTVIGADGKEYEKSVYGEFWVSFDDENFILALSGAGSDWDECWEARERSGRW